MANILNRGSEMVRRLRKSGMSDGIVYSRGAYSVEDLKATKSRRQDQLTEAVEGIYTATTETDWIFERADLVLNGAQAEPQAGDLITETISGVTTEYQVLADDGQDCWKYNDRQNATYRVRVKRI